MRHYKSINALLGSVRRAVDDFDMIGGGTVAAAVSGGKDSMTLLCALKELSLFYPKPFKLRAICVDLGFEGADFSPVSRLCGELSVPLDIVRTQIKQVVFDARGEKCPCSLCANMRRGALHAAAVEAGCETVALGHHMDDAVETFMMNLIDGGRIDCFRAKTFLSRRGVTVIRPLVYLPEKLIAGFVRRENIELCERLCPEDGSTERARAKALIRSLSDNDKGLKKRLFGAMLRAGLLGCRAESAGLSG